MSNKEVIKYFMILLIGVLLVGCEVKSNLSAPFTMNDEKYTMFMFESDKTTEDGSKFYELGFQKLKEDE